MAMPPKIALVSSKGRSLFFGDLSLPFYGCYKPGVSVSAGVRESFWLQGMHSSPLITFDSQKDNIAGHGVAIASVCEGVRYTASTCQNGGLSEAGQLTAGNDQDANLS
jgi:hypothetical protein